MRVVLILVDGMRPDALEGNKNVSRFMNESSWTLNARTVFPSVTLPCHMSMFHSVPPERHGVLTNTFTPMVRPVDGLFDVIHNSGKEAAIFYSWEQLRDVYRPGHIRHVLMARERTYDIRTENVTSATIEYIRKYNADLIFTYLGWPDAAGHNSGWMNEEYMNAVWRSWESIYRILEVIDDDTCVIVTADHGGHGRSHGTDAPEDMIIPAFFRGKPFSPGKEIYGVSIMDIAPTATAILGINAPSEWEGKSLV